MQNDELSEKLAVCYAEFFGDFTKLVEGLEHGESWVLSNKKARDLLALAARKGASLPGDKQLPRKKQVAKIKANAELVCSATRIHLHEDIALYSDTDHAKDTAVLRAAERFNSMRAGSSWPRVTVGQVITSIKKAKKEGYFDLIASLQKQTNEE